MQLTHGVRFLVLGNGAAGAEKQALALSRRIRSHLQRAGVVCIGDNDADGGDERDDQDLVHVPLKQSILFQKLPPALQFTGARILRDPFFGYAIAQEDKKILIGGKRSDHRDVKRVVIGCGRTTVSLCAAMGQLWAYGAEQHPAFNIQIQHPRVPLDLFDAVITPRHDLVSMDTLPTNVHPTHGTVCSMDTEALEREGNKWQRVFGPYVTGKRMRVAWLLGGPCRGFAFSEDDAAAMTDQVLRLLEVHRPNASLLVTFSRRTPRKVEELIRRRLKREFQAADNELFVWDGHGMNPYEAILHHATAIVTTPDSISMTTEAIATGKPVLVVCADRITGKHHRFHDALFENGFTAAITSTDTLTLIPEHPSGRHAIEQELDQTAERLALQILRECIT